ncbi:superoxide dismutase [Candidatus Dojkabacteria bacterium]|uniref:Superoxide dismutase n=1 Tax=Candidatus Dojkabacteria bacterium TaxID=2099670 RepID=A0A955L1S4_9BACT|nr:superoxide dismutase [Candidatus Dojkabacteria bacterium]
MAFERVKIAFEFNALEPNIDAKTMEIHSEKHHQGYTDKLNAAVEDSEWADYSIEELLGMLEDLPDDIQTTVRNNGGGFANHNLYFSVLSPKSSKEPTGELKEAIDDAFDSFEDFKEEFSKTAAGQFGSGWAFLALDEDGELYITAKPNQDSPLMDNHTPILGIDVWEHAYYLNYQNKRADYIEAFWNVIDWEKVTENFEKAQS